MNYKNEIRDDFSPVFDEFEAEPEKEANKDVYSEPEDIFDEDDIEYEKVNKNVSGTVRVLKRIFIAVAVLAVITVGSATALVFMLPENLVYDGITCAGRDLGNMTYNQALEALQQEMTVDIPEISVNVNGMAYPISRDDIELSPLIEETAQKVYNFGKSDNKIMNAYNAVRLKFKNIDILPVTTLNEDKLREQLTLIGNEELGERKPHSAVGIDMTHAQLIPGTRGFDGDTDTAIAQFKAAISEDNYTNIAITLNAADPEPITAEMIEQQVNIPATDARYILENNQVSIVPEQSGRYVNRDECAALISSLKVGGAPVDIPCYTSSAEKTQDILRQKMFNYVLGKYTTHFAAGGNRGQNVANAASRINGKVILSGETFSFNETVGRRSAANGFKPAPEYLNGETVTGIGGGTCQVSTTLYSAVLYADLQVVTRRNHSMSVGYAPLGQDATVSDGGIDFKFHNDTDYPVKIEAGTSGGELTVKIIGTQPDVKKTVKITHKNVSSGGLKSVKTTRTVYDESGNVLKTDNMGISKYKPH